MCATCEQLEGKSQAEQLVLIGRAMRRGASQHLSDVLDRVLQIEPPPPPDPELDAAWEAARRPR